MAANASSLGQFLPKDMATGGSQAARVKVGNLEVIRFDDTQPEWVEFDCVLPRPAAGASYGYTATTGIKVNIWWMSDIKAITGAVKWVANITIIGGTDLPDPTVDLFSATYEATTTTSANATTAGGAAQTVISVTIANIKGAQTTAAAAGDVLRIRVKRQADAAGDTLVGYANVFLVELQDY